MIDLFDDWGESIKYGLLGQLGVLDDRAKYIIDDIGYNLPVIGSFLRTQDNVNFYDDYFRNHPDAGGYGNIKYHRANLGFGSSIQNASHFVSKNIEKFYDDW